MDASPILPANPGLGYRAHKEEIDAAVRAVLESGWYILGRQVAGFEQEFAAFVGVPAVIGVGSGTDALHLALRACGIGPGDLVLTVSNTATATVAAIEMAGAQALLVDIDPETLLMDPARASDAADAFRGTVKAILPVHLYGRMADMPSLMAIAEQQGLAVIEDCAQAHGAALQGRRAGAWGHFGAFSFYPTKNLGALGDAGALTTGDAGLAERARLIRQYGWRERYVSDVPGINTRLDEIQAAILRVQLRHLDAGNARRRAIAAVYDRELRGCVRLPAAGEEGEHVYHQYVVRTPERDRLAAYLKSVGIGTSVLYPQPVHLQPAYRGRMLLGPGGLGRTEAACREILCLPVYPELSDEQVHRVCQGVREWTLTPGRCVLQSGTISPGGRAAFPDAH